MSSLSHHGIKGQRWGVRRFQNKDGTRTALGKHRDFERTASKVVEDLSNSPRPFVKRPLNKEKIRQRGLITQAEADQCASLATGVFKQASQAEPQITGDVIGVVSSTSAKMYGLNNRLKQPTSIAAKIGADAKADGITFEQAAGGLKDAIRYTAVSDSRDYVNAYNAIKQRLEEKGYAEVKCKNYFQKYQNGEVMHKAVQSTFRSPDGVEFEFQFQTPESQAAKELKVPIYNERRKAGNTPERNAELEQEMRNLAEQVPDPEGVFGIKSHSGVTNSNKLKHTSIGGTMYIEGNALILGDSSYLEHHGIRGQRWGVRRFQNRDGSLTNAGRKRLGYATKGAVQTVGKAFKAGVKVGGNAVKAAKAHHEKKEAEKLEKKKEKASKTRLGVMANKDLFTNEEIRKLNERFKLEDEMKMATLQKGVEIAKAVGTIAQNVGTVAKTYEDVTGQSLSPIKRKAAEEKARQDKEDRERRIAREDADEARKAAKEERDIAIHEQTLRKAIASADTQEFTAQKTKAEADSSILDLYKKGQNFNGSSDATGQSWMEKATSGGKNVFEQMKYDSDPEYRAAKDAHDEKVARKERMAELERREKEREAEKAAASRQNAPQQKQGGGGDDALFSQKGSLPLDKDRYRNNRAMEKAKQVKEDAAEERAKKQDEKAAKATIDDMMEARRQFTESARANSNGAFDRETAANYIKGKAKELPSKLNPVNAIARKITNRALKEEETNARKALEDEYKKASRSQGRDEANYTMYYNRVNALQSQGYSERQAKKVADTESPFSSKRNRRFEYNEKVGEIETTHRKNAKEINKANKELTDYYYKLVNGPGYEPGSPKREALDQKYAQKRGELERLEKDNNEMLDREKKKAKKILEHSFSIQNGVLFVDSSDGLAHHGVKGQKWGVRRFQNEDGSLTPKGRKHYEKAIAKIDRMQTHSDARRGRLERQHPFAVTGAAIAGAVAAGLSIAATGGASVAAIAAGSAISAAVSAGITHASYSVNEAWEGRGTKHRQKKRKEYEEMLNHDGLIVSDGTLYLEHHGIKGQRWGVRRFQNADGTRTALGKKREMYGATVSVRGHKSSESVGVTKKQAKGKAAAEILKNSKDLSEKERKSLQKHVDRAEKETAKLEKYKEKKKQSQEENTEEAKVEQWNMMTTGMISPDRYKQNIDTINKNHKREIDYLNKMDERDMANERAFTRKTVAKGMGFALAATAGLAGITAATTGWMVISGYAAIGGGVVGVISGEMKRNQYRDQRRKEMGIDDPGRGKVKDSVYARHDAFTIQNGTLFINAGEPYLEHHGVKGMKWGKHLMAGKGVDAEGGGGGGFAEDDEKLKEMAKKAGMSVAEYRTKMASKLGGAASKVGSAVYDAAGGNHKKNAEGWRKMAQEELNAARASEKSSHENSAKAASQDRKYGSGGDVYRRAAESDKENAKTHHSNAKARSERAASEQAAYEKSLAGKYDKMKADRARKKSAKSRKQLTQEGPKAKKKVRIESASAMGLSTNDKGRIPVDARRWGHNATNKSKVSVGKRGSAPKTILDPKHTDTSHRRKSVGEIMNNAKNPTPGDTPIAKPTQYTHANRPRGREKYYKLGQESKGVKKRSRRVRHFDGSDELYTEGTKLVVNSKWG